MAEAIGVIIFEAIGAAALGSTAVIAVGATTLTLGTVVGAAVLVGGSIGLQMLLAPELPESAGQIPTQRTPTGTGRLPTPESGHQPLRQSIAPRTVAYGRVRIAGTYVLFEAKHNGRSYDVVALHHGRVGGFAGFYLHDDVVTNGQVATAGGYVSPLIDGRYGNNKVYLSTRLGGVPEQTYGEVTADLPELWQLGVHRGDGLASLLMICEATTDPTEFTTVFPRGKPEPSAVVDATPIFDPRDATQARNNPATWKTSRNPVLQIVDYLTNDDYGMGLDWDLLVQPVLADIIAEANLAEGVELHPNGIGEYRYQSCGAFNIDSDPADVVGAILDTCDGWISENGDGTLAIKVGHYREPQVTFQSRHIRGINLQYDVADEEIVNELAVTYTEALLDYKTAPADPWRNEDDIAERGRIRSQPFALPWVQSFSQARRLAKRRDAQNNADLRGTITTTLYGLRGLGERWIRIQAPELPDLDDIVVEVRGVTIDLLNSQLTFRFISIDEDAIDAWEPAEEGDPPTIPPKYVASQPPPIDGGGGFPSLNPVFFPHVHPQPDGSVTFGAVNFDDPHRPDLTYQTQFRITGSAAAFTLETNRPEEPEFTVPEFNKIGIHCLYTTNGATGGQNYELQIRSVTAGGVPSAWSASQFVQT